MKDKNKQQTTMEKLTQGYEKFIAGRELNAQGKQHFEKVIKKSVSKPKNEKGKKK